MKYYLCCSPEHMLLTWTLLLGGLSVCTPTHVQVEGDKGDGFIVNDCRPVILIYSFVIKYHLFIT